MKNHSTIIIELFGVTLLLNMLINTDIRRSDYMNIPCNMDCFNCTYPDCIVEGITPKERKEMNKRDHATDGTFYSGSIIPSEHFRTGK